MGTQLEKDKLGTAPLILLHISRRLAHWSQLSPDVGGAGSENVTVCIHADFTSQRIV